MLSCSRKKNEKITCAQLLQSVFFKNWCSEIDSFIVVLRLYCTIRNEYSNLTSLSTLLDRVLQTVHEDQFHAGVDVKMNSMEWMVNIDSSSFINFLEKYLKNWINLYNQYYVYLVLFPLAMTSFHLSTAKVVNFPLISNLLFPLFLVAQVTHILVHQNCNLMYFLC